MGICTNKTKKVGKTMCIFNTQVHILIEGEVTNLGLLIEISGEEPP